jgi:hypothetical protein
MKNNTCPSFPLRNKFDFVATGFALAITASTDEKAAMALDLVGSAASSMSKAQIERVKARTLVLVKKFEASE